MASRSARPNSGAGRQSPISWANEVCKLPWSCLDCTAPCERMAAMYLGIAPPAPPPADATREAVQ
jgi:hypothetical protein